MIRTRFAAAVAALLAAAPATAIAGPFGPVEQLSPEAWMAPEWDAPAPQIGVDAAGWATHVSTVSEPRDAEGTVHDLQVALYERCGQPAQWRRAAVLGDTAAPAWSTGVAVAPGGSAVAVWIDGELGASGAVRAAFRPAGGAWGAPETIATEVVGTVDVAIADNGDATVLWERTEPAPAALRVATRRAATGTWSPPHTLDAKWGERELAMAPDGTAFVIHQGAPQAIEAFIRPPGGDWPAQPEKVVEPPTGTHVRGLEAEIDGAGAPLVVWQVTNEIGAHQVQSARRVAGNWDQLRPLVTLTNSGILSHLVLARHPGGAVLGWIQDENAPSGDRDAAVSRFTAGSGSWETPKVYDAQDATYAPPVAVAADLDGNATLAVTRSPVGGINRIVAAQVPSLGAAWPELEELPEATPPATQRPRAAGGGRIVVGWQVHDGTGQRRSEAVATGGPAPDCPGEPPDETPLDPPAPPTSPPATPAEPPASPVPGTPPLALRQPRFADFVVMPSPRRCVRGRRLRLRLRAVPGYPVDRVTVVAGRRRTHRKGDGPLRIAARTPARARFIARVTVRLRDGRVLTDRRRYRLCGAR